MKNKKCDLESVRLFINEDMVLEEITIFPTLTNPNTIYLGLHGWSINLHKDGTWCWEDTTGG